MNILEKEIYVKGNKEYWINLSKDIQKYCEQNNIKYTNFFYHEELVNKKKQEEIR